MLCSRLAAIALIAALGLAHDAARVPALAQTATPPAPSQPAPPAPTPPPAQTTPAPPSDARASPAPLQPGDAFGEEVTLPEKTIVYLNGHGTWDSAFETLIEAFKSLNQYLDKQGLQPNGPAITIYTQTDDTGFRFRAALPIAAAPNNPPKGDIAIGKSPSGKALKFVHRGSYDAMDTTYEAITNYLDDKRLEAKDLFIEEYVGDPIKTTEDKLVVNVFVPVK
jgi:effector-binding domain-containing protein